jgi:CheY-like chemotaxis protein
MSRVLIIEDNENNMELITFILEAYGYITLKAETGYKGVDMAVKEKPDFIILDIQLPDILGTEVLDLIRKSEIRHSIPIIAMTSFAMAGDREKLLAQGCDGYIEKPIDPEIVIDQIQEVLGAFDANINS